VSARATSERGRQCVRVCVSLSVCVCVFLSLSLSLSLCVCVCVCVCQANVSNTPVRVNIQDLSFFLFFYNLVRFQFICWVHRARTHCEVARSRQAYACCASMQPRCLSAVGVDVAIREVLCTWWSLNPLLVQ